MQAAAVLHAASGGYDAASLDGKLPVLPSPRARVAWRGGVGGGGRFDKFAARLRARVRGDTPHPRPLPAAARGEGRRRLHRETRSWRGQLHQGRQESRQCLAGAGRRDQQRGPVVARPGEQIQLMVSRRPAARGEPFTETVRQQGNRGGSRFGSKAGRHTSTGKHRSPFRRGPRPRPACGERSKFAVANFRVRGVTTISSLEIVDRAPHPDPLPIRTGRGRVTPSPACRKCPSPCR